MENESYNSAEYGVTKKPQGQNLALRLLLIFGYLVFAVGYCLLFTVAVRLPQVIAVLPIFLWIAVFFTWRLVSYDIEYRLEHGELIFTKLRRDKRRTVLLSVTVREAPAIAPFHGKIPAGDYRIYDYRGDLKSPDSYRIDFADKEGRPAVACFEATEKLVKMLSRYNKNTLPAAGLRH